MLSSMSTEIIHRYW